MSVCVISRKNQTYVRYHAEGVHMLIFFYQKTENSFFPLILITHYLIADIGGECCQKPKNPMEL